MGQHSRPVSRLSAVAVALLFIIPLSIPLDLSAPALANETPAPAAPVAQPAVSVSSAALPYLDLSVILANKLHDFMLNGTSNAYYYELSSNWKRIVDSTYSTLGNAFITLGMIQLYQATGNKTYLSWASANAESFWRHGWDSVHGGFYDTYSSNWKNTTCQQTTQPNALFGVDFLGLASANGSAIWLQRANSVENLLNERFWSTSYDVVEQYYNACTSTQSGDVQIEVSIGSYLWATSEWARDTSNSTYNGRMADAASFAENYLWDGSGNTLPGGTGSTDCGTTNGYLGFMRSAYADLSGLEDCRKGANENIWGALGMAELYNTTGGTSLLQLTNRDLTWINSTFWDATNGGYHEDAFRNDTLRSACSTTNDPRDYPGWTEGEQPMLWWQIGQLTGNATESSWAGAAEDWTAAHQWNYTDGNGGEMTCLDSNTLPDPGSDALYDWVQGSALYTYSTVTTSAPAGPKVVQPVAVATLEEGAPGGTYTVDGCSASPATGSTGSTTSFTMSASCSFTISFTNAGGTRLGFITGGTFSTTSASQTSCSGGTCSAISLGVDYQALLSVDGGNGVSYSLASETSDGWYKYGDSLTVSTNSIWNRVNGVGTRLASWNLDGGTNTDVALATAFTTPSLAMTTAHNVDFNPVTQYQITVAAGTGGTASATTGPPIQGDTGWYDTGTIVQVSATPSGGYSFSGWSGSGAGSYTGGSDPATVTMNGAVTETAMFSTGGGGTLALDGSASVSSNGATSVTASLTTSGSPDVIIAFVTIYTGSSAITVSSISSTHLSFKMRGAVNNAEHESVEEWYAVASSPLSSETITISFSAGAHATGTFFGISGANTATVFDPNLVLPSTAAGASGSTPTIGGISTSNPNDMIIAAYGAAGPVDSVTAGSGYAMIYHGHDPQNFGSEYEVVSSTQSGVAVRFAGTTNFWAGIADAIEQSTSSPATVTQPIAATLASTYGGSVQTVSVRGGCSPSPSTFVGDGETYDITMTPNCPFTLLVPAAYQITAGGSSTSCASGTCTAYTATTYEQSPAPVTQPLAVQLLEPGSPAGTYAVNGCSASPATGATGATTVFSMTPSCSFTISFTNSGGTRWGFITGSVFSPSSGSQSTCPSGSCTTISLNADYQVQLVVNGGNDIAYSLASETSDGWYKFGDSLTVSSNAIWGRASGTGTRLASWNLDEGSNTDIAQATTFTTPSIPMTGATTVNFNSVNQYQVTFTDSPSGGGTSTATTGPPIPGDTGWYDSGTSVSISATASSGYNFASWTGTGSGSYTGSGNPATITMDAAIQQTAAFSNPSTHPALDGSATISANDVASATASLTTSHSPDVIIAFITVYQGSGATKVSAITGAALSFTLRGSVSNSGEEEIEEWYAIASTTLSSESITVTLSSKGYATGTIFGVSGANTASPFDTHSGLPATATGTSGTAARVTGISTNNADDLIIAAYGAPGGSDSVTAGSGFTTIYHGHDPQNFGAEYDDVSSTQSSMTVGFAGNTNNWAAIADAIQ